jgi:hypothetical protein
MISPLGLKAAIAALALAMAFAGGFGVSHNLAKAHEAKMAKMALMAQIAMQKELNNVSARYEVERARADQALGGRVQTVREYWRDRPAPSPDCAVPAALVGLLNGAVSDANAATGQSRGPVPYATAAAKPGN